MPSLLEALEEKYGLGNNLESESLVSIFVPKLPPRLSVPELLVLNDCDIDRAGEPEDLRKKCCTVKELDLAQNKLANWDEVFTILAHMPRIEFVNLSLNRLAGPVAPPTDCSMGRLRSLVLNNTRLEWDSVEALLNSLPALEELHLSLNEYTNVLIDTLDDEQMVADAEEMCTCAYDPATSYKRSDSTSSMYKKTSAHSGVRKLHFTGNPVTDWAEVCRLGRVFPKLESLVLAECPLKSLEPASSSSSSSWATSKSDESECSMPTPPPSPSASSSSSVSSAGGGETPYEHFKCLTFLNLSSTKISTWDDIDRLARFPALRNLRVRNWPLWDKCEATEHERRQLLIARLPQVTTLNGGGLIGGEEREDAERAFIRYYMDKPESDRPERYTELVGKHGKLDPLVNIDLRPEKRVKVTFTFGDNSEVRSVDVHRTVVDLRLRLERLIGIPASKMRLFYVDQDLRDLQGPEEMKYPHKQLYSYNIRSGDEIIVDLKN